MKRNTRKFVALWRAMLRRAKTPQDRILLSATLREVSKTARQYFSVIEKY